MLAIKFPKVHNLMMYHKLLESTKFQEQQATVNFNNICQFCSVWNRLTSINSIKKQLVPIMCSQQSEVVLNK